MSKSAKRGSERSGSNTDQNFSEVIKEDFSAYAFSNQRKAWSLSPRVAYVSAIAPERLRSSRHSSLELGWEPRRTLSRTAGVAISDLRPSAQRMVMAWCLHTRRGRRTAVDGGELRFNAFLYSASRDIFFRYALGSGSDESTRALSLYCPAARRGCPAGKCSGGEPCLMRKDLAVFVGSGADQKS